MEYLHKNGDHAFSRLALGLQGQRFGFNPPAARQKLPGFPGQLGGLEGFSGQQRDLAELGPGAVRKGFQRDKGGAVPVQLGSPFFQPDHACAPKRHSPG